MADRDLAEVLLFGALQGVTLEVRSRVAPPITIDVASLVDGSPPGPVVGLIQPTIIVRRGPDTLIQSSPAGIAGEYDWLVGVVVVSVLSLVVLALVAGRD